MVKIFTQRVILCLAMYILVFSGYTAKVYGATIADFKVPEGFTFTKDVQFGTTTRPDVSYLQNILNMSTTTRVAATGPGSLKTPSNFFGVKTRDALGRFQALFSVDIEFEKSISTSTATSTTVISSSTLDVFTRAVLNKLIVIYSGDRERYNNSRVTGITTPSTEEVVGAASTGGSGINPSSGAGSQSGGGMSQPHEYIYTGKKLLFKYSPQGQLLNAIGGESLVNSVFSYTPAGIVGQMSGAEVAGAGLGTAAGFGIAGGAAGAGAGAASAAAAPLNFGGQSTAMVTCTCSSNILIYVRDVRFQMLPLIYQPGVTVLYQGYQPRTGVQMLGNYVPGGVCLIYAGTGCTPGGVPVGTMTQLGTSLTIGK